MCSKATAPKWESHVASRPELLVLISLRARPQSGYVTWSFGAVKNYESGALGKAGWAV